MTIIILTAITFIVAAVALGVPFAVWMGTRNEASRPSYSTTTKWVWLGGRLYSRN